MSYLGTEEDGHYTIAMEEEKFIEYYDRAWDTILEDVYYKTELLGFGHKFRPRLVYWGYRAGKPYNLSEDDYMAVSKVAVSIELVHKASTLLDDYIDGDTARHGMDSFHITYGPERTMMYSLNILCRALRIINEVFMIYINDSYYSKISMRLVIETLEEMSLGVLKELDLTPKIASQKLAEIQEIMQLETASLVTNSLLVGYLLSQNADSGSMSLLTEIGKKIGYVFQILNDMEPFCSQKNNEHKGSRNTDITRHRKNICAPLIYASVSTEEQLLLDNSNLEQDDSRWLGFFEKYAVKQKLFDEISATCKEIHHQIDLMEEDHVSTVWKSSFHSFVDSVIAVSEKRLE